MACCAPEGRLGHYSFHRQVSNPSRSTNLCAAQPEEALEAKNKTRAEDAERVALQLFEHEQQQTMVERIRKFLRSIFGPEDILAELREINRKLSKLESCVQDNRRSHGHEQYFSTGHWNDK